MTAFLSPNTAASTSAADIISSSAERVKSNGFDAIRLVAATMVIYGHAYPLTGSTSPGLLGNAIATVGVKVFFVTSGFLIARSWLSDPALRRFTIRRALRILPGLVGTILLTVLALGPAFTQMPLLDYARNPGTWLYFWNIVFYPIYYLPGVFASNVYPGAVNGSLWSLPAEVLMYILTPLLLGRTVAAGRVALPICGVILAALSLYYVRVAPPSTMPVFFGTSLISLLDVAVYFQVGSIYAIFGLQRFCRPVLSAAMLLAASCLAVNNPVLAELMLPLLLPFATISIGLQHFDLLDRVLRHNDVSYGLYLYGFPVQQAVVALASELMGPATNFALSFPIVLGLALLSWQLIERRALSWKPHRRTLVGSRP